MSDRRIPSGFAAARTIAALTWKRMLRGQALWVGMLVALLPVAGAIAFRAVNNNPGPSLLVLEVEILALLAPMFIGSSIGEEIETRTATYLWSRPLPRWAVLAGKLIALAPLAVVIVVASWIGAARIGYRDWPSVQSCLALVAGGLAMSLMAAGLATLSPRHGMALAIVWMLFIDFPLGILPATVRELSVSHHIRAIAGISPLDTGVLFSAIALALLGGLWTLVAALRLRRLEA